MTRLGVGASYRHILTVRGRKFGRLYSTPVDVLTVAGDRWLVAAYGPAGWVRNVRAAGEVTLSRGGRSEKFSVDEADAQTAIPVLRAFIREIKVTRPYFDAYPGSPDDMLAAELKRHAVFRLTPHASSGERTLICASVSGMRPAVAARVLRNVAS
jgi:deazaflavin-dependent oxidoreductase (nitroreductase family)